MPRSACSAAYSLVCRGVMDAVAAEREGGRSRGAGNLGSAPGEQVLPRGF